MATPTLGLPWISWPLRLLLRVQPPGDDYR